MSILQRCSGMSSLRGLARLKSPALRTAVFSPVRADCSTKLQTCRPFFNSSILGAQPSPRVGRAKSSSIPPPSSTPAYSIPPRTSDWEAARTKTTLLKAKVSVGVIIALCVGVYLWGSLLQTLAAKGEDTPEGDVKAYLKWFHDNYELSPRNIEEGRYHTFLSSGFNHGNLLHLGLNMYVLWGFGPEIVFLYGLPKALGLYLGSIVAGSAFQYFLWKVSGDQSKSAVGASGGSSGLLGAYALWQPFAEITMFFIPMPMAAGAAVLAAVSLAGMTYPNDVLPGLGHSAHFGGLVFGALWWAAVCRGKGRFVF